MLIREIRGNLEATATLRSRCGLRPYVEWHGCTFEGTDIAHGQSHLEATATLRSPYTSIFSLKINFRSKRLYMCIFFCTFARFFVQVRAYMRINCMEVR